MSLRYGSKQKFLLINANVAAVPLHEITGQGVNVAAVDIEPLTSPPKLDYLIIVRAAGHHNDHDHNCIIPGLHVHLNLDNWEVLLRPIHVREHYMSLRRACFHDVPVDWCVTTRALCL